MSRRCARLVKPASLVLAGLLALSSGAWARDEGEGMPGQNAPKGAADQAMPAPTESGLDEGAAELNYKALTERGVRLFSAGQYDAAIEAFGAAYVLRPNAMFLFNMGQAHRKAGRPKEALLQYQLFLRKAPQSPLRPETEAYVALCQAQLAGQGVGLPKPPTAAPEGPVTPPLTDRRVAAGEPGSRRRWVVGVVVGGAALVGTALGVGLYLGTRDVGPPLGIVEPTF